MTLIHNTWLRNTALAAVGLVAAGFVAATQARSIDENFLTFNKDVALPGVVLPAGTYRFDIANPETSHDVVRVRSRNGRVLYMGFTLPVQSPNRPASDGPVTFTLTDARPDTPAPIAAWYPIGMTNGHQFVYR